MRSRSRQCNIISSSDIDCVGETVQQTTCNEWDCPGKFNRMNNYSSIKNGEENSARAPL